jgi:hypothetical protein
VHRATRDDVSRGRIGARGFEPIRKLAQLGAAIDVRAGKEVRPFAVRIHRERSPDGSAS